MSPAPILSADNSSSQKAVIEEVLILLRQGDSTVQDLATWLPTTLVERFGLKGCQIELYTADPPMATLIGSTGQGWLTPLNKRRNLAPVWHLYSPLVEGELACFNSQHNLVQALVPPSLTWLGCPLTINTTLLGTVWLTRGEKQEFKKREQQQFKSIVDCAAIALHQAQLKETIDRQQSDIQQLRNAKDEFLELISHELFVPLGNIQLSTQTLERIFKDASWRQVPQRKTVLKVLSLLSQECRRQKQFTDNLITLMFSNTQKTSEPVSMNLHSWLPSLLRTFAPRFEQESITLKSSIPKKPLLIDCDIHQLERTINELLNNALQYTPTKKTVTVTVKAADTTVAIDIANTGAHIPVEHQPHIFDKFYRIAELDQRQYGGSGLGLAIAKQLTMNLGGTLTLRSTKQKTTFTVTLPR
ncbi:sensor histidine kinase [Leptothoe kymatousa]|uniref:histidine kinase n=1 Tax=Leptothoe kymatousa TAU-MAC 1615 TaxID=2364775 RepID=A0ABS5Y153_9CYAN|nr:HAMP domain-containing sensor histidine kinase [Leptothoe kymatousa]MBT9311559.1 HAMP domain-containing histidine kinase [Leptothoe kymatousa TAU-MAC 1615]